MNKPLFASTDLAARIESAERDLIAACVRAVRERRPNSAMFTHSIAGGIAAYTEPGSPLNKVAGIGFAGPLDESELTEVEHMYAKHSVPIQVELSSLADPSIGAALSARGYRLQAFENVLGIVPNQTALAKHPEFTISTGTEADLPAWLDAIVTAFANPDTDGVPSSESFPHDVIERVMSDMSDPSFVRYIAAAHDVVIGGASMRIGGRIAQLCGAGTLPGYRRRGLQSALLHRRLSDAAIAKCEMAVITTAPGSKSQENAQRLGFSLLYTRAILVRSP